MAIAIAVALRGGAALAVWWGVRRHRPQGAALWHAVAVALVAYATGDLLAGLLHHPGPGKPPAAMAAYAVGFAAFTAGLVVLGARRRVWRDTGTVLDSAALLAAGATVLAQVQVWSGGDGAAGLVLPLLNVAVIALVALLAFVVPDGTAAPRLLLAGAGLSLAGDVVIAVGDDGPGGALAEPLWLAAALLLAAAASHRSMAIVGRWAGATDAGLGRSRLAVLTIALLTTPVTVAFGEITGDGVHGGWLALTATATTAVVAARVWRLVAESAAVARLSRLALEGASPAELLSTAGTAPGSDAVVELALAHARSADVLRFRAMHDALTGLLNRWGFERAVQDHLGQTGVGLAVVDLDGFKPVNDALGHAAGDDILRQVGARLVAAVGEDAVVGRYGGDEFTVLVPGTTADDMALVAERMEAAVRLEVEGLVVRASVGTAWSSKPLGDLRAALRRADASMYEVKRQRVQSRR